MSLDKIRTALVLVSIVIIEMIVIGALATGQTDRKPIGLEGDLGRLIKIGAIYNLEGSQSPLDQPSAKGAKLAVQEINALGGIDGRKIELILCDGKSDPAKIRECAESFLDENVSAMMGLSDTDMVLAAAPVSTEAKIPFVTSGATAPRLASEYDCLFLACFGDNVQAAAGAEYAFIEMGLKTCSLLVDGDMEYARILASYFKDRYLDLGGDVIMEAFVNGSNLRNLSQAIRDKGPEMIYLAAGPEEAGPMIEVMRKAGIQSPVFGGDSLDSPELKRKDMGRVIISTHALMEEKPICNGAFAKAYSIEYGYPPENAFSALGYDTVNLLAEAIDRANSSDPQAILKALENTSGFKGVTGEISYQYGSRIPNKDVTMILQTDGEITGSMIVTPKLSI